MKKTLLLLSMYCCALFSVSHAQQIELLGLGINGKTSETLSVADWNSVTEVNAYATSKGFYAIPPSDAVLFDNGLDSDSEWSAISGDQNLSSGSDKSVGVYSRFFESLSNQSINVQIQNEFKDKVHSFYAFVNRNRLELNYTSFADLTPVFMFHNGSDNPFSYTVNLEPASAPRDLIVRIPVSELDSGSRNMIIHISSGNGVLLNETFSENTFNQGNSLLLLEYEFKNASGSIDQLKIDIYSPDPNSDDANGDSFFVGGVIVDAEKIYDGCTLTQGYWKNHSSCKSGNGKGPKRDDTWDLIPGGGKENTSFFLSDQDYCEVFETKPGKGGKYYILAHQYIAAQLNLLANADPNDIVDSFKEATDFLEVYTPQQVKGNKSLEAKAVELGGILDDFNNGRIGPGHCDEDNEQEDDEVYVEPVKQEKNKALIYPNPASNKGKIAFVSKQSGLSSVEIFNIHGQKVGTLFEAKIKEGDEVDIEYDASRLPKGIYFALIKNGTDIYKEKISITK